MEKKGGGYFLVTGDHGKVVAGPGPPRSPFTFIIRLSQFVHRVLTHMNGSSVPNHEKSLNPVIL